MLFYISLVLGLLLLPADLDLEFDETLIDVTITYPMFGSGVNAFYI